MTDTAKKKRQVRKPSKRDPFEPLLASLLTLDWEISDGNIRKFESELEAAKKKLAADRYSKELIDTTFPVCNYLRVRKGSASPASMQFLHSATRTLLHLRREKKLKAGERQQVLEQLLGKFRNLMKDVQKTEAFVMAAVEKAAARQAKKLTPGAEILKIIRRSKKGVDVTTLKEITGFTDSQIRSIIYRASKAGKIKRISRGVYTSA